MLKKLSLTALIAISAISVLNATPVTEVIKNADLSGYLKLRFDHNTEKRNEWDTEGTFKIEVPVNEELKLRTDYNFEGNIKSNGTVLNSWLGNSKLFLKYNRDQLNVIFGKIPVNTPITDSDTGTGFVATYKVIDNLTIATAFLDTLDRSGDDTIALGAIYEIDKLNSEAWFFTQPNETIKSNIVVRGSYEINNIKINGDIAVAKLEGNSNTQSYFNVSAEGDIEMFNIMVGFAKTGEDGGTVVLNKDAPISAVLPTKQIDSIANNADASAFYAKAGSNLDDKTNIYGAFAKTSIGNNDNTEIVFGGSYKYNKKMKLSAYYSIIDDNKQLRFEAKYSF